MNEMMSILGGASIRIAVLIALVWLVLLALPRTSAATRHAVWVVTLIAAAFMPFIGGIAPEWRMPHTLPVLDQRVESIEPTVTPATIDNARPNRAIAITTDARTQGVDWIRITAMIWVFGSVTTLLVFGYGWNSARRLVARSRDVDDPRILEAVSRGLRVAGVGRQIDVRSTDESSVAFIFGVVRPSLVVPASAELWDDETLSLVVAHEVSHVRRNDALTQRLADILCAAYWFHPAMWFAASRIRQESELACDDEVLLKGNSAASYADLLLTLAQSSRGVPHHVLAMARSSTLATRVVAALDKKRARKNRKFFGWSMVTVFAALAVIVGAAHPALASGKTSGEYIVAAPVIGFAPGAKALVLPEATKEPPATLVKQESTLPSRFTVQTRQGVCGRGIPDEITYSSRPMDPRECRSGMVLITVTSTDVHATVGAPVPDGLSLDSRIAASKLLSMIPSLDGDAASRAIQAAALMQNGATAREILSVVKNDRLEPVTRRMAVTWYGIVAGDAATEPLLEIARDRNTEASVREQALIALDLSNDRLIDLFSALSEEKLKQRVVNAIAGSGDEAAKRRLIALISADADEPFRSKALERLSR